MIKMELKLLFFCFKIAKWLGDPLSDPIHIHLIFSVYIGVARGGIRPPLIEMPLMIKMSQKRLLFLQFQFFFSIFANNSTRKRTSVINNNIDPEASIQGNCTS